MSSDVGLSWSALDTPALWTDLDKTERNIASLAAHFKRAGVNWRPHTKGIKVPALAHKLLRAGAIGLTCAKVSEAEVMAQAGVTDILVANQIVTPTKITRLVNLRASCDVKVCVDNADNVAALAAAAQARGVTLGVLVELNTGMERSGVLPGAPALALARRVHEARGLRLAGLMTWEGHNLAFSDPAEKRRGIEASIAQLLDTVARCRAEGLPIDIVSAGGSGTYTITSGIAGVTEIEAGGGIFCDLNYQSWGVELEPSLFVKSTVTSRPAPGRIILDAGFKTLPRGFISARVMGVDGVTSIVHSAEHGIVTLDRDNATLKVGDAVDLMVGYSDATVFAHDTLYGMRGGIVEAAWPVLGRGKLQ
ncbi:MAG: alanine racemase [Thermoflexales bacterium]|nr:alanine racemase [Thermoflexales bacterium]